ncbi:hypothetical protein [Rheinheimera sp. EpRS3]|uniref:hypothetical protein n=1 Tax=Rheinheimera sp. EpRS3 TaxID=1712383 RepID=UPI000746269C|nr:hypothetical protein [Rheinheimera sp. EpRS3]KUM52788.1 hypothetical protein AR688_10995 [Rheinheimera sp. EpRS3]
MDNLPDKYRFSHEFCFFLHDQLLEALKSGEKASIFHHEIKMRAHEISAIEGLSGESLLNWLEENGHKDLVLILYYKQICAALISDMLHFIYEALQCSKKGKLTVAYALLRKPFKENLFYLEWLLGDPVNFLSRFDLGNIKELSINSALNEKEKIEIIAKALNKTSVGDWLSAEYIYALRFDKKFEHSLEPLFQKANHLVTTFRFLETEGQNFNFVFSDHDSWESQWNHLYTFLPILLFHAVEVFEALLAKFATRADGFDLTGIRTLIGFAFWSKDCELEFDHGALFTEIRGKLTSANLLCETCKTPIEFDDQQLLNLYEDYLISCNKCEWEFDLWSMHKEPSHI